MREILFKSKSQDGSWVEGFLNRGADCQHSAWWIYRPAADPDDRNKIFYCDPSTVRQYVGLKDSLGQRIFEGDIIRAVADVSCIPAGTVGYVAWSTTICGYEIRTAGGAYLLDAECGQSFAVIGNTVDDAQLLRCGDETKEN